MCSVLAALRTQAAAYLADAGGADFEEVWAVWDNARETHMLRAGITIDGERQVRDFRAPGPCDDASHVS